MLLCLLMLYRLTAINCSLWLMLWPIFSVTTSGFFTQPQIFSLSKKLFHMSALPRLSGFLLKNRRWRKVRCTGDENHKHVCVRSKLQYDHINSSAKAEWRCSWWLLLSLSDSKVAKFGLCYALLRCFCRGFCFASDSCSWLQILGGLSVSVCSFYAVSRSPRSRLHLQASRCVPEHLLLRSLRDSQQKPLQIKNSIKRSLHLRHRVSERDSSTELHDGSGADVASKLFWASLISSCEHPERFANPVSDHLERAISEGNVDASNRL